MTTGRNRRCMHLKTVRVNVYLHVTAQDKSLYNPCHFKLQMLLVSQSSTQKFTYKIDIK